MGSPAELTLYYRPPLSPQNSDKTGDEYIAGLVEERRKIQAFQKELPLCMHLINEAIEACQNGHSSPQIGSPEEELEEPQNCLTPPEKIHVLTEFIPLKRETCQDFLNTETQESGKLAARCRYTAPKSDNACQNENNELQRAVVIDQPAELAFVPAVTFFPIKGGAFSPFKKLDETNSGGRSSCSQSQQQRKRRRCWSPDLHRCFLNALHHLGGSQVATPKQIKDLMKVDGLTNDEVKSHLQKYRLHSKKPGSALSQTQLESVWDRSILTQTISSPVSVRRPNLYQPPISGHSLSNPPLYNEQETAAIAHHAATFASIDDGRGGRRRSSSSKNSKPGISFWKGQHNSLQEGRENPHPDSNPRLRPNYVEEANSDVEDNSRRSPSTPRFESSS